MALYRVCGWSEIYENNRTRELKRLQWVPLPNKQDGDGYTEMVARSNAAAAFGAWVALVQVASKCDPRGTLVRDNGKPHDAASLARISRLPEKDFKAMIPVALSVGWLEDCDDPAVISQEGAGISQDAAQNGMEGNGREGEGTEGKKAPAWHAVALSLEMPEELGEDFRPVWASWIQQRRELRKPYTPTGAAQQLKRLGEMGPARARAAVELTIAQGWQGIREPEPNRNGRPGRNYTPRI